MELNNKLTKLVFIVILGIIFVIPGISQEASQNDIYRDLFQNIAPDQENSQSINSKRKLKSTNPKELENIFLITGIIWDEENPLALILIDNIPRIFKSEDETPLGKILDIDFDKILLQQENHTELIYLGEKREL